MSGKRKILTVKEGILEKYGGRLYKRWNRRFFVLSAQMLCYFKAEEMRTRVVTDQSQMPVNVASSLAVAGSKTPLPGRSRDRIFLATITKIDYVTDKKRPFAFLVEAATYRQKLLLSAQSEEERDDWMEMIKSTKEKEDREEKTSDLRKSFRRLDSNLKRVTLVKEAGSIGCTIKICGGPVIVNRVVPDGPIAQTGVLKPGDQILEIHGRSLAGLSMEEIVKILKDAPTVFIATIEPMTSTSRPPIDPDAPPVDYAQIDYDATGQLKQGPAENPFRFDKTAWKNPPSGLPLLDTLGIGDQSGLSTDDSDSENLSRGGVSPRSVRSPERQTEEDLKEKEQKEKSLTYAELNWKERGN
eukprot:m.310467 g.310467  ORF g.310467 m.310467 type:complete len:356 (+) comp51822_c0_seq1:129-1196(+)